MNAAYLNPLLSAALQPAGNANLWLFAMLLALVLLAGVFLSRHFLLVRPIALSLGGLTLAALIGIIILADFEPEDKSSAVIGAFLLSAIVAAASLVLLPLAYLVWQVISFLFLWLFEKPPYKRRLSMRPFFLKAQQRYDTLKHQHESSRLLNENEKLQRHLDQARRRIADLQGRPDALPENADAITRLTVAWSQERERLLRDGNDNSQPNLDQLDARYANQLAQLLDAQGQQRA